MYLEYFLYVVEPLFTGDDSKFVPLSHVLKTNISNAKKYRLFQNLVIIVKSLHELGISLLKFLLDFKRGSSYGIMSKEYLD